MSAAAGTVLAASVAATALVIGPGAAARPTSKIPAGRFGLADGLADGRAGAADPGIAGSNFASPSAIPSLPGYASDVDLMAREQHADQARAQAGVNAAVVRRARAAAHRAMVLAEHERATASQPAETQPAETEPQASASPSAPSGSPQQIAMAMLADFGWPASQFSCLDPLWERESNWNPYADNPISGAYGIPQALPGAKMATAGADWASDATTQIRWGLGYIKATYGSPCGAWDHEEGYGWY